jgi:hypothetical protein
VVYVSDRIYDNLRPDGVIRGKWRIPDVNVGEWSVFMFEAANVVAPVYVD